MAAWEVQTVSCSTQSQALALLEAAAHQARCYGHRKLYIHGLEPAFAKGTNLVAIEFDYAPGALVLDPALASQDLDWPYEVCSRSSGRPR